jgi:hypothetical protein
MNDDLLLLIGWTCVAVGIGVAVILFASRGRPKVRELLTLPDPSPAVQDAIDTGDAFDAHVDQALAIANPAQPPVGPHMHGVCGPCGGRVLCFRDAAELVEHLRSHAHDAEHFQQWEHELATPTRKDQP